MQLFTNRIGYKLDCCETVAMLSMNDRRGLGWGNTGAGLGGEPQAESYHGHRWFESCGGRTLGGRIEAIGE